MAKYKNTKQVANSAKKEISDSKLHKYLIAIPLIALAIKFIVMNLIASAISGIAMRYLWSFESEISFLADFAICLVFLYLAILNLA